MIDLVAYKIEAYDLDGFINSLNESNKKYLIIIFNPILGYKSYTNISNIKNFSGNFLASNKYIIKIGIIYKLFYLPLFCIDLIIQILILLYLTIILKPKNLYVDNTYISIIFIFIRFFSKKTNILYASQDWLGDNININLNKFNNILKYGFSRFFIVCDFYGAKYSSIVLNHTENLQKARNKHWGSMLNCNENIYKPDFCINYNFNNKNYCLKNQILFLGNCSESSSIEKILESINNSNYVLTIIGPINDYLIKLLNKYKNNNHLSVIGPVSRASFIKYSEKCFMGINIINDKNFHSKYAIQSKTIDYIKLGLPVLLTKNLGVTADFIDNFNVGLLLDSVNVDMIRDGINEIYINKIYEENITKINSAYQCNKISEFLV